MALVTLVGKDRQFFKCQTGLAQPWAGEQRAALLAIIEEQSRHLAQMP